MTFEADIDLQAYEMAARLEGWTFKEVSKTGEYYFNHTDGRTTGVYRPALTTPWAWFELCNALSIVPLLKA